MIKTKEKVQVTLTSLQKKMMAAVTLPLAEECPTALRYSLAKFDAQAVTEAYNGLVALEKQGLLENK